MFYIFFFSFQINHLSSITYFIISITFNINDFEVNKCGETETVNRNVGEIVKNSKIDH